MSSPLPHAKARRLALRLLLSGLLLTAISGAATGLQLCVGPDGHIEIETHGACDTHGGDERHSERPDECDPCVDVVFSEQKTDAVTIARSLDGPRVQSGFATTIRRSTDVGIARERSAPIPAALAFDQLSSVHSVVLLM